MVRMRPETALEVIKKGISIILFLERKKKQYSFFQGIETSIPFLGKKENCLNSIDFK